MLAMIVGALFGVLVLFFVVSSIYNKFKLKSDEAAALQTRIGQQKETLRAAEAARAKRVAWEKRSLPSDPQIARSLYQKWLFGLVERSSLADPTVKAQPIQPHRGIYQRLTFDVAARGTLPELVQFLHEFYRADHLHQIRRLHITPIEKSKELELDFGVETLILPGAPRDKPLSTGTSGRLAHADLKYYLENITRRNKLGPPNRPPVLESIAAKTVKQGQSLSLTAKAKDDDPLDRIRFDLVDAPQGARIDATSGAVTWLASRTLKPGDYALTVRATDDGLPPKSAAQVVKIKVERPGLRLATIGDQTISPGKTVAITAKLAETDANAKPTYSLGAGAPRGATLDPRTGLFRWTAADEDLGKSYTVSISADDGQTPPSRDTKSFKIAVADPRPQLVLDFHAQHTYLTGIIDANGEREVWFLVRSTGEQIVLPQIAADGRKTYKFQAGSVAGEVVEVHSDHVIVVASGQRLIVPLGKSLAHALPPPRNP
jgi:hypothetical protein